MNPCPLESRRVHHGSLRPDPSCRLIPRSPRAFPRPWPTVTLMAFPPSTKAARKFRVPHRSSGFPRAEQTATLQAPPELPEQSSGGRVPRVQGSPRWLTVLREFRAELFQRLPPDNKSPCGRSTFPRREAWSQFQERKDAREKTQDPRRSG